MTLIDLTMPIMRDTRFDRLPVGIIGAGPIGLAAAAHLPELGQDIAPNGAELTELYLAPLAALPEISSRLHTGVTVEAVTREGMDRTRSTGRAATPFALRIRDGSGSVSEVTARAVIDASGTYRSTDSLGSNSLDSNGLDPLGREEAADHITDALPDLLVVERAQFAGRHITVVGAGHSAANTLITLATLIQTEPGTRVTWVVRNRSAGRVFTPKDDQVDIAGIRNGGVRHITTDLIVNATGFRPDLGVLREIRLSLDEIVEAPTRLAPLIDPNLHSCGTVKPHGFDELEQPEQNFFIAGMKSYGRAPTFLLATGYEQVCSTGADESSCCS